MWDLGEQGDAGDTLPRHRSCAAASRSGRARRRRGVGQATSIRPISARPEQRRWAMRSSAILAHQIAGRRRGGGDGRIMSGGGGGVLSVDMERICLLKHGHSGVKKAAVPRIMSFLEQRQRRSRSEWARRRAGRGRLTASRRRLARRAPEVRRPGVGRTMAWAQRHMSMRRRIAPSQLQVHLDKSSSSRSAGGAATPRIGPLEQPPAAQAGFRGRHVGQRQVPGQHRAGRDRRRGPGGWQRHSRANR